MGRGERFGIGPLGGGARDDEEVKFGRAFKRGPVRGPLEARCAEFGAGNEGIWGFDFDSGSEVGVDALVPSRV